MDWEDLSDLDTLGNPSSTDLITDVAYPSYAPVWDMSLRDDAVSGTIRSTSNNQLGSTTSGMYNVEASPVWTTDKRLTDVNSTVYDTAAFLMCSRLDYSRRQGYSSYKISESWKEADCYLKNIVCQMSKEKHNCQGVYIDFGDILQDNSSILHVDTIRTNVLYLPLDPNRIMTTHTYDVNLGKIRDNTFQFGVAGIRYFPPYGNRQFGLHTGAFTPDAWNGIFQGYSFDNYGEPLHIQAIIEVRTSPSI